MPYAQCITTLQPPEQRHSRNEDGRTEHA